MAKMLSKQAAEPVALDATASMLCLILASQPDLKLDNAALAPLLGLKDRKNVPRKVDSMIKPFGYHYEKGRVYVLEGKKAGSATDTKDDGAKNEEVDKKPKPAKEIAASKGKKRSSSPEQDEKVVNKKAKKALTKKEIKAQEQAQKKDEEAAKTVKAEAAAEEVDKQVEKDVEEIKKENSCSDEDGQDDEE